MELPKRPKGDRFTTSGRYRELELRNPTTGLGAGDFGLVRLCVRLPNAAGPLPLHRQAAHCPGRTRAVASALHAAGFRRTRVVLQQWNPRLRPSLARIDGRPPDLLFVSGMQIHSAAAYHLIAHASGAGRAPAPDPGQQRQGDLAKPWDFFGLGPDGRRGARRRRRHRRGVRPPRVAGPHP